MKELNNRNIPNINLLYSNPEKFLFELKKKISFWFEKLNDIIDITVFFIALGCLVPKHPQLYAWIGVFFILMLQSSIKNHFPKEIKYLKEKKKRTDFEEVILKGIESHFLGFRKSLYEGSIFWFGMTFLFFVATGFVFNILSIVKKNQTVCS